MTCSVSAAALSKSNQSKVSHTKSARSSEVAAVSSRCLSRWFPLFIHCCCSFHGTRSTRKPTTQAHAHGITMRHGHKDQYGAVVPTIVTVVVVALLVIPSSVVVAQQCGAQVNFERKCPNSWPPSCCSQYGYCGTCHPCCTKL